jgi:hypothetical protein
MLSLNTVYLQQDYAGQDNINIQQIKINLIIN